MKYIQHIFYNYVSSRIWKTFLYKTQKNKKRKHKKQEQEKMNKQQKPRRIKNRKIKENITKPQMKIRRKKRQKENWQTPNTWAGLKKFISFSVRGAGETQTRTSVFVCLLLLFLQCIRMNILNHE